MVLVAMFSLTKRKHNARFFFFKGDSGFMMFWMTLELSPFIWQGDLTKIPNDLNIYLIVVASSVANFIA